MTAFMYLRWASLVAFALAVAAWDLSRRIIPNGLVVGGLGAGLVLAALSSWGALVAWLLGAVAFGGPMVVFWLVGAAGGGDGLIGAGDAKAALAFGGLLGFPNAVAGLWWGALAGGVLAVTMVAGGLWRARSGILAATRRVGIQGAINAIVGDPAWCQAVPYGGALAIGALLAAAHVHL
jgi:Flp pilus assembly protein protease CpaA